MKIENITEMTAGTTGSGSVTSVDQPVRKIQKRAGNLFKGKTTKKPFYEQEATSSIAQGVSEATLSEEDFILMPGQGHKLKPGLISKRPDHEVEMARGDLYQSAKNAKQICDMLSNVSEMQGLDGWVQAKITKASDYLNSVRQYLEGRHQAVSEGADDICPQCGMKGCKCAPGKCKCKPKPGYPKSDTVSETEKPSAREKFNKGLKKAGYDPEKGADRLFSLLKKQAEEREKFEKAMPAVYGDKEGVAEGSEQKKLVSDYDTWRDQVSALGGEIHPQQNKNHMVAQSWSGDTIGEFHMGREQGYIVQGQQDMTEDEDPCWKDYRQLGTKKKNGKTVPNCVPKKK